MAQRGELDLFFASGLQIDAEANVNLHLLGEHDTPRLRMPGAYGIGLLYYMARRVVVFRTEHTRRSLVEKVDFVTAAGSSPREFHRAGGPTALVTPKATLAWDAGDRKWLLASIHSGISLEDVLENMAFQPDVSAPVPVAPPPDPEELYILRTVVKQKLARVYPDLAARIPSP